MSNFRVKAPAFRIPQGSKPVFLNQNQLFILGSRGGAVYDVSTRKKITSVKACSNATEVSVCESDDWVATKNSSGEIAISRLSDGSLIHKYKRPPYQDSGQLGSCRDGRHFVDSTDGVVHLHSAESGAIIRSYSYGDEGWMTEGTVFAEKLGQVIVGVTPKYHNPIREKNVSFLHFFNLEAGGAPATTIEVPGDLERFALSPDESRLALVLKGEELGKLEVRTTNLAGKPLTSCGIEAKSVYFGSPTWTLDGKRIVVINDLSHVLFLNAETLQVEHEYHGPKLTGISFQPGGDLIALSGESGYGGIVLPESQFDEWSTLEGEPRYKRLADQFYAYSLQIELRKACPPRAAVLVIGHDVIFESEKLVGYFRYLPGDVVATARLSDAPELLGKALRKTLKAFEDNPEAKEAVLGPSFPGELERLISSGIPKNRITHVRYLGHEISYEIDHSDIDMMLSVNPFEGRLHFWLCRPTEGNCFYESCWPHAHLDETASDARLGNAILGAIEDFPSNIKFVD